MSFAEGVADLSVFQFSCTNNNIHSSVPKKTKNNKMQEQDGSCKEVRERDPPLIFPKATLTSIIASISSRPQPRR